VPFSQVKTPVVQVTRNVTRSSNKEHEEPLLVVRETRLVLHLASQDYQLMSTSMMTASTTKTQQSDDFASLGGGSRA
jgi:hypothetical protein